ncbi:hypothetical protein [Streptomyces venezuelae]|uniref:hypothetical protein n=1 Tax=Streptomyces venezuelae TaxID=54571 RepID=UPI00379969AC
MRAVAGTVTAIGVVWALWLTFWPPHHEGEGYLRGGGSEDAPVSCGAPALFDRSSFSDWLYEERELRHDVADEFATACADKADERVRGAMGVIVVVLPVGLVWVRSDVALRAARAAAS